MNSALRGNALLAAIDKIIDAFIVVNIVGIALLACIQVMLRYVFSMPLFGIEELCYFPTIWLYLGAAVKASSEKGQLVARVLEIFIIREKTVCLLRCIAAIISCCILLWLVYWGYDLLRYSLRLEKLTDTLFIPWLYIESSAFIAFSLMVLYSAVEAWEYFRAFRTTGSSVETIAGEVAG